ncbi:hypothetical protein LPJ74_004718 [Coemansia sp. RSA 1843]|nr:hypothetical protein LPJ74_004718 [Coemansia sp. RSA 1843]
METVTTRDLMLDMMENIIAALKDHGHKETADAVLQSIIDKQPRNSGTPAQKGLPRKLTAGEDSKLKSKGKKKAAVKAAPAAKTVKAKKKKRKRAGKHNALVALANATDAMQILEQEHGSNSESSLDVRIRSHGKISNYVEFISSILQKVRVENTYDMTTDLFMMGLLSFICKH